MEEFLGGESQGAELQALEGGHLELGQADEFVLLDTLVEPPHLDHLGPDLLGLLVLKVLHSVADQNLRIGHEVRMVLAAQLFDVLTIPIFLGLLGSRDVDPVLHKHLDFRGFLNLEFRFSVKSRSFKRASRTGV